MALETMYEGKSFSPSTILTQGINDTATRIYVEDIDAFPDAPNLAVLGETGTGEVIKYFAKGVDFLDGVQRGVDGVQQVWNVGDKIARNFTKADYDAMRQNIIKLSNEKLDSDAVGGSTIESEEAEAYTNIANGDTVSTAFGKLRKWFTSFKALAFKDKVASSDVDGTIAIFNGGTGAVDAAAARANLGAQAAMLAGMDYVVPPTQLTALPTSGTALTANAEYRVSATVGTYTFAWPSSPFEAWLRFSTAATFAITFPAGTTYIGGAPSFEASKDYEMSVKDGVVIVAEVVSE